MSMDSPVKALTGKRVVVAGGFGYVGSALVRLLEESGIDFISIDRLNSGKGSHLRFDLSDAALAAKTVSDFRPDFFVHCGTHSALAYRGNFLDSFAEDSASLVSVLRALSLFPSCRLVFFSSSYVYSGCSSEEAVSETLPLKPLHNFGAAKLFFEQLVLRSHHGSVVFRLASVFGPGRAAHPNALLNMVKECADSGKLSVWGSGSRMMQYVCMEDVLESVLRAFSIEPGIYNLGCPDYVSVAETANAIAGFFRAKIVFLKDKPEGDSLPLMSCEKLKKASGTGISSFSDSLKSYLLSLQKNFK